MPFLIFIFSFILQMSLISKGPYHLDCLYLATQAQATVETGRLHYLHSHGYPLVAILGAMFVKIGALFGRDAVWSVNFMSVVFSSLSVVVFYWFVKKLADQLTGLLSALLLAVAPIFLALSVYGNTHPPFLFFLLTGFLVLLIYFERGSLYLWVAAIAIGMAAACRLQDTLLSVIPLSFLFFSRSLTPKSSIKTFGLFAALASVTGFLFYAPLLIDGFKTQFSTPATDFIKGELTDNFLGLFSTQTLNAIGLLVFNFSPVGFLMSLAGLGLFLRRSWAIFWFLTLWAAGSFFIYAQLDFLVARFLLITAVPLTISLAYFCAHYLRLTGAAKWTGGLIFFATVYLTLNSIYPIVKLRHDRALLPEFAVWVSQVTEPEAVIITKDERHFIEYYGHRQTFSRPAQKNTVSSKQIRQFKSDLDKMLSQNIPVYITGTGLYSYDVDGAFAQFMKENYSLILVGDHLSEGWQPGDTVQWVGKEKLFQITKKIVIGS